MSSTERAAALSPQSRETLLRVAASAIEHELAGRGPLEIDPSRYAPELGAARATFVTLRAGGELLGCIGTMQAREPLVVNVAKNAVTAAFEDPRFAGSHLASLEGVDIHISVLGLLEPVYVASEAELLAHLRPGIDGLLIEEGRARGTFLPAVWETLPDPAEFLAHLKHKAGLPIDYWSPTLEIYRYTVESIP
jgi:AmmeMemoRadiSam system protein A